MPDACAGTFIGQTVRVRRTAAVLFTGLLALSACSSSSSTPTTQPIGGNSTPVAGEPSGTKTFEGLARSHVDTPVKYPQTPPVGGPHNPVWQTCGFYSKE